LYGIGKIVFFNTKMTLPCFNPSQSNSDFDQIDSSVSPCESNRVTDVSHHAYYQNFI